MWCTSCSRHQGRAPVTPPPLSAELETEPADAGLVSIGSPQIPSALASLDLLHDRTLYLGATLDALQWCHLPLQHTPKRDAPHELVDLLVRCRLDDDYESARPDGKATSQELLTWEALDGTGPWVVLAPTGREDAEGRSRVGGSFLAEVLRGRAVHPGRQRRRLAL